MSRHTLGSPRNSPRMNRKQPRQHVSVSLATTPTQGTTTVDFPGEGVPGTGSKLGGLDRVLLERNLDRLLQERGSHPEETSSDLGRLAIFLFLEEIIIYSNFLYIPSDQI